MGHYRPDWIPNSRCSVLSNQSPLPVRSPDRWSSHNVHSSRGDSPTSDRLACARLTQAHLPTQRHQSIYCWENAMHCYTSYSHLFLDHWIHLRRVLYPIVSVEKTLSSIPWPQDHLVKNDASDLYVAFQKFDTHWSQLVAPVFDMVFQDLAYVVLKRQINTEKTDVYTVSQ